MLELSAAEKVISLFKTIGQSRRQSEVLYNLLLLELRTNLALLQKIKIGKGRRAMPAPPPNETDQDLLVGEKEFLKVFLPYIKTDALMALLTLVGPGQGIRKRLNARSERLVKGSFDDLAVNALRKHQTLIALSALPTKFLTKNQFTRRVHNLTDDFVEMHKIVMSVKPELWYQFY